MSQPIPAPQTVRQLDELITRPDDDVLAALDQCDGDVAVLGAGGKMGFHVTRMLQRALESLGRSNRLIGVSRFSDASSRALFEEHGIETIASDLSEPAQLETIPLTENVIFLAGVKFGTSGNPDLLKRMNATMPSLVADRFRDSRIVALSTGCVYSFTTPRSGGSTEQSETDPPGDYAQSCMEREQAFQDAAAQHGTTSALVRLNYSNELRYGVLVDLAGKVLANEPIDLQTGHVNVIWQGDAASQILQCLPRVSSPPWIINITGSETLSVRQLAEAFGQRLGRTPDFHGQEAPTCWLSNNTLARQHFGEPSVSVETMVDWIAQWLVAGGELLGKPTHFQTRDGNY